MVKNLNGLKKAGEILVFGAIASLLFAGCSGSGGGDTAAAPTALLTVTPGKGLMTGATVVIKDAYGNTLGNASTSASGVAAVSIPASATGPFIVSVICPSSCQYFDEKSLSLKFGSATARAMLAIVPSAGSTNIGVTVATNAAAQYALNTGAALTPASVKAANDAVTALLGLSGVNILTPPTIISNAATLAAAMAGTTDAARLSKYSAAFAMAASGVSALDSIADYGDAWKNAALTPASGVIMPSSIDTTALASAASAIPATTISNVTTTVTATTVAAASAVALVDKFFADGTNAGGFAYVYVNDMTYNASGVPTSTTMGASKTTVTATGTNSYSFTGVLNILTAAGWGVDPDPQVSYELTDTGWANSPSTGSAVNNLDGTITTNNGLSGATVEILTARDLGGTAISCQLYGMSVCKTPGTYPAGATEYSSTTVTVLSKVESRLYAGTNAKPMAVTDAAGLALTALPAADATFCSYNGYSATVYKAILPAPASGNNFNSYSSKSCTAADITAATATTAIPLLIGQRSTVNAAVPSVVTLSMSSGFGNLGILAAHAGKVYFGYMTSLDAGTKVPRLRTQNKLAANALLAALGYPTLP